MYSAESNRGKYLYEGDGIGKARHGSNSSTNFVFVDGHVATLHNYSIPVGDNDPKTDPTSSGGRSNWQPCQSSNYFNEA